MAQKTSYPENKLVNSSTKPHWLINPQVQKINELTHERDPVLVFASEHLMWISPQQLYQVLYSKTSRVKVVDCRIFPYPGEHDPSKIKDAIVFQVEDKPANYSEKVFNERLTTPAQYKAESLFPEKAIDIPEAVVFYCDAGRNRSPIYGFWYAVYLARRLSLYLDARQDHPKVYVLEDGFSKVPVELEPHLFVDKNNIPREPKAQPVYTQPPKSNVRNVRPNAGNVKP